MPKTTRVVLDFDNPELAAEYADSVRESGEVLFGDCRCGVPNVCAAEVIGEDSIDE